MNKKEDMNLTENEYNTYLNKYKDRYKVIIHGDGIRCIVCKYGTIQPFSMTKPKLCFEWEFHSSKKGTFFLKTIPDYCVVTQGSGREGVLSFPESMLNDEIQRPILEDLFKIRKRKVLSEETKQKLRDNLKVAMLVLKNKKDGI